MASIIPGFEYDIFISYRQKDNKGDRWVSEFVEALKTELESTFKEEISVYFDINPYDGLLVTHDVDASLKDKLKSLVFIPIISRTYCDPKSFAWDNELKVFINLASNDKFGFKIKLLNGNVANRVLPIRIHDLDVADTKFFESVMGGVMRPIDFVYKETGVNRQLRAKDDDIIRSTGQVLYRDQINKVALTIKEIIENIKISEAHFGIKEKEILVKEITKKKEPLIDDLARKEIIESGPVIQSREIIPDKERKLSILRKPVIWVPGILIILAIFVTLILILNHRSKVKWAKQVAIPQIEQLINKSDIAAAFTLVQKTKKYISKEPKFLELSSLVTTKLTILTDPPGADVYIREYSDNEGEWKKLGKTPIRSANIPGSSFYMTNSFYLTRIEKPGYEDVLAIAASKEDTLFRKIFLKGTIPQGMVYVESYWDEESGGTYDSSGFFMDRYEVTNKQFKEFVDNGGYRNPQYWKNSFRKNGKIITFDEAMAEFKDKSGRPGPATWEAGDYPDGQADYPVGGVSWYEAAAYAESANKNLPTANHFYSGAGFWMMLRAKIASLSNFSGKGPDPLEKHKGVSEYGTFDMAGNVREWCWNETPIGHIIRGGGWDDAIYMFWTMSQLPSFDRSPKNGFRCVQYIDKEKIPENAFRLIDLDIERDLSKEKPAPESSFIIYKNQFLYDSADLKAAIEEKKDSYEDWTIEKISFNAAYGKERMIAYLFLPKKAKPPFQTLIFYPGTGALFEKDLNTLPETKWFIDYLLKSGRAVMCPIYKGTLERNDEAIVWQGHQYTEWLIKWVKDFSRSIDYLETRADIDKGKIGFYGHSWGGYLGGIIPAVENRLAVSVLVLGGFSRGSGYQEVNEINYIPRIKIPVLMLNGRYDAAFPLEKAVIPFFKLLGTPEKDKRIVVYDTDHYIPKSEMIKETLNWLDRYLGPVK